jgi:hypothetical protein
VPEPGVGGAGSGLAGLAWPVMTPAAARLLQELRRQLHYPSRLEQEIVDQPLMPPPKMPSWEPASTAFTISGTPPKPFDRMLTDLLTRPSANRRDRAVQAGRGKRRSSCSGTSQRTCGDAARRAWGG